MPNRDFFTSRGKVQSMDDNCGEWVECMGVASGCGEQEVGVASGSGWSLWVWLLGVVVRRYIDFLIVLIPTPLVSVIFCSSIPTFCSFLKCFSFFLYIGLTIVHIQYTEHILHATPLLMTSLYIAVQNCLASCNMHVFSAVYSI